MRSILLATVAAPAAFAVALLSAGSALAAGQPELDVNTLTAAIAVSPGVSEHKSLPTNNQFATLSSSVQDLSGASFAHAQATATFGALHAYADAFMADPAFGDAQATAEAESADYFNGATFVTGTTYNMTININGSTSAQPQFGPGPDALFTWRLDDLTARDTILLGSWFEPKPTNFVLPFVVPAGHEARLFFDLFVFAYDGAQSVPGVVFSNYRDTVHTYIDPVGGGGDVVGLSGHDYATPSSAGVPEPAGWALMLAGFGGLGAALRRRHRAMA